MRDGRPVAVDGLGEVRACAPTRARPSAASGRRPGRRRRGSASARAAGAPGSGGRTRDARRCAGSVMPARSRRGCAIESTTSRRTRARVQRRHRPAEQPAPVVPDDDGVLLAERADQRGDVGRQGGQVVAAGRLVAGAVAAQVGGDDVEAGVGQRGQLRRARSTRTAGSRAAAGPAAPRRPRRRAGRRRWRRCRGASTGPGSRTLVASGRPSGGTVMRGPPVRPCRTRCRAAATLPLLTSGTARCRWPGASRCSTSGRSCRVSSVRSGFSIFLMNRRPISAASPARSTSRNQTIR